MSFSQKSECVFRNFPTVNIHYFVGRLPQIIALAFVIPGLASCQPSNEEDLVMLTSGGAVGKAVEAVVKEFQRENPGVKVRMITAPGQDYYVKSLTMLAGRAHVDVLWMGQGFGMFASRGALLDLTPFIKDQEREAAGYQKTVLDWYRFGDGLYGIPYGVDMLVIGYNKDLFDAANVPYPTSDWSLGEMLRIAKRLTRVTSDGSRTEVAGLGFVDLDYRYYGLSLLNADNSRFALNTEAGQEWMNRNLELIYRERILQRGSDMEAIDRLTGFLNGQVAMVNLATWDLLQVREKAPFRWDVIAVPVGISGKRVTWASSSGFSIARHTRHPELAWKLIQKLSGPEFQKAMLSLTIPMSPSLHDDYRKVQSPQPEHLEDFFLLLNHMEPSPRIATYQEVESEWNYWRDRALLRQIPVEEALREAESNINRILHLHKKGGAK